MTPKTFVGFDNYIELFHSDTFYTALKNNLIWLALFLLAPPLGLLFALVSEPADARHAHREVAVLRAVRAVRRGGRSRVQLVLRPGLSACCA